MRAWGGGALVFPGAVVEKHWITDQDQFSSDYLLLGADPSKWVFHEAIFSIYYSDEVSLNGANLGRKNSFVRVYKKLISFDNSYRSNWLQQKIVGQGGVKSNFS